VAKPGMMAIGERHTKQWVLKAEKSVFLSSRHVCGCRCVVRGVGWKLLEG
jgi:hypothetical protein